MCDAAGWEAWSYDSRGRVVAERRNTNSVTKSTAYAYNFHGGVTSITYPSGRTVTYTYNSADQTTSAVDGNGTTYASNAVYNPAGGLSSLQEGASLVSTMYYNNRLQPCRISVKSSGTAPANCADSTTGNVLDMTYGFNYGSADNGNAASITNNRNTARSQSFTYDELNRISTAKSQATTGTYAWGLAYTYDPWANLLNASVTQGSAYSLSVAMDPNHANNRLMGYSYDAAGNMLNDGVNSYAYNAEGELVTAGGVTYTYDGDGNRVKKSSGKLYWYGVGSDPLSESDGSGNLTAEFIFLNGARIAMLTLPAATVNYYVADHLGSSRVVTNASGTILDDSDFMPYGQETSYSAASGNHYKFTGKERDPETGLDDFAARFYSSTMGRFMSADDSKYMHPADPQTFNLYSYVANNPINAVDPTGHDGDKLNNHARYQPPMQHSGGHSGAIGSFVDTGGTNSGNDEVSGSLKDGVTADSDSTASMVEWAKNLQDAVKDLHDDDGWEATHQCWCQHPPQQKSPMMIENDRLREERNRPWTPKDVNNMFIDTGKTAEQGVNLSLIVSAPNFAVMGAAVLADLGVGVAVEDVAQGVRAGISKATINAANADRLVGAIIEKNMPLGVGLVGATQFVQGAMNRGVPPTTLSGTVGWLVGQIIRRIP
jgi:RHS repeat-associated protein